MGAGGGQDDLNLVPFIDLFSVLICFLIMTAVWNQIEALSTNVDNVTSSDNAASAENPNKKKETLTVTVLKDRMEMAESVSIGARSLREKNYKIANLGPDVDLDKMQRVLTDWKKRYPEKKDVIVNTDNQVLYKKLIQVFDALVGAGYPDVGINTQ
ncbi:MAG: biopolymer transporter ExbD [Bdellovibrionota bacterium]